MMMMFKLSGIYSKTKRTPKTSFLALQPVFMSTLNSCSESLDAHCQNIFHYRFMRRKKGGKKPQHRKLPEDLKKQRKRKTHANYIPLASGFFLKRFIFSSGVWTPLLLSFPPPRPPTHHHHDVRALIWVSKMTPKTQTRI